MTPIKRKYFFASVMGLGCRYDVIKINVLSEADYSSKMIRVVL